MKETNGGVHIPVLKKEVLELLHPEKGQIFIDGTINGGGHAKAILENVGKEGMVLGIDWDCEIAASIKKRFEEFPNIAVVCGNYADMEQIAHECHINGIDGVLLDLGFSSYHIDQSGRGFSFLRDEPLDMRYNTTEGVTAENLLNRWSEKDIFHILREYGEERFARRIARAICEARKKKKIQTTQELVEIVVRSFPHVARKWKIHPATRTFQALRMTVNRELENLARGLSQAYTLLRSGGTVAVISFHSGEDRIVKRFFQDMQREKKMEIKTKKPIRPTEEEIWENPRARSAHLRVAKKL